LPSESRLLAAEFLALIRAKWRLADWRGVGVMIAKAREYQKYARECIRMADRADSEETRDRLLELAQVWMNAALIEVHEEGSDQDEAQRQT
jgi:hypothetical protein